MITLDPMFFIIGGQRVKIGEIQVASKHLTDDQVGQRVGEGRIRGIIKILVDESQSVSGFKRRLENGAVMLGGDLFLLKDKFTVKRLSPIEVSMQDIDASPCEPLVLLNRI